MLDTFIDAMISCNGPGNPVPNLIPVLLLVAGNTLFVDTTLLSLLPSYCWVDLLPPPESLKHLLPLFFSRLMQNVMTPGDEEHVIRNIIVIMFRLIPIFVITIVNSVKVA